MRLNSVKDILHVQLVRKCLPNKREIRWKRLSIVYPSGYVVGKFYRWYKFAARHGSRILDAFYGIKPRFSFVAFCVHFEARKPNLLELFDNFR